MKYLLFMMLLASCTQRNVKANPTKYNVADMDAPLEVLTIEGCQYFYKKWANATVLCHKGNCNNPIHPEHTRQ